MFRTARKLAAGNGERSSRNMNTKLLFWFVPLVGIFLIFALPLAMLYLQKWSDKKAIEVGKKIVKELGFEYLRHQRAQAHYGMHFQASGRKYYAKYLYGPFGGSPKWLTLPPDEMVKADKQNLEQGGGKVRS